MTINTLFDRVPLNQLGFDHATLGVVCFVLVAVVGTALVVQSHAYIISVFKRYLEKGSAASGYCLISSGTASGSNAFLDACTSGSTTQIWTRNDIRQATVTGVANGQEFTLQSLTGLPSD